MRALSIDHTTPTRVAFSEILDPVPAPNQALVRVAAASVNPADRHGLVVGAPGSVPGWESAGVVIRAAVDGTGPAVGSAVASLGPGGGWAQLRAVDTAMTGLVPDGVDLTAAATLVIAGASALRALRALGPVLGRRVLVTGATGAVGRFAVQLGRLAGAHVVAGVRDADSDETMRRLGADEVLTDGPAYRTAPVHGVVETVGGDHLPGAFARLVAGAVLVSVGRASGEPATFSADSLRGDGGAHGRSMTTFFLGDGAPGLADDLSWLAIQLADGHLVAPVDLRIPWADAVDPAGPLGKPGPHGKVVLEIA